MLLEVAVCDDEKIFRDREKALITDYLSRMGCEVNMDEYTSGEALLERGTQVAKYDIVFLDVNMDKLDGIETARRIRKFSKQNYIVFVTAFVQYAVSGYEVDAIRFILKDDQFELRLQECLDAILQRMIGRRDKQMFAFVEKTFELPYAHLMYVESRLHKLLFHVRGEEQGVYTMYDRLDTIDDMLREADFCRTHQSYLVNLQYVQNMERYNVHLTDGSSLGISKARYNEAMERWICYKGEI